MGVGRGKGTHLTDVLAWMREKNEGEEWARRRANAAAAGDVFMQMGFVWEIAVEDALKKYIRGQRERVATQEEIEVDGIKATIDARVRGEWRGIEEYKLTYRSERCLTAAIDDGDGSTLYDALEENFWWYLAQVKGYCYAASIYYKKALNRARLVIFFDRGDYSWRPPHGFPHPHCFELAFTAAELASTWKMILNNRDAMVRERKGRKG